jgi:hypothetical protein
MNNDKIVSTFRKYGIERCKLAYELSLIMNPKVLGLYLKKKYLISELDDMTMAYSECLKREEDEISI